MPGLLQFIVKKDLSKDDYKEDKIHQEATVVDK